MFGLPENLMSLTLDSVVSLTKDQVSCDLSGETAVLGLKTGHYYGLDAVASRIWSLVEKPRSVRSVRDTLVSEFAVDEKTCQSDVLRFLRELEDAGLLQVR